MRKSQNQKELLGAISSKGAFEANMNNSHTDQKCESVVEYQSRNDDSSNQIRNKQCSKSQNRSTATSKRTNVGQNMVII